MVKFYRLSASGGKSLSGTAPTPPFGLSSLGEIDH